MGNSHKIEEKNKNNDNNNNHNHKDINNDEEEEDEYSQVIKTLNTNTEKIEKRLKNCKKNENLLVLIESGALAPPHKMHVGIMEMSKKYIEENLGQLKVLGGYLIPSSDKYVKYKLKKDFIPLNHRVNMTQLLIKNSEWLDCLDWGFAYGEEIRMILEKILKKKFPDYNIKCVLVFGIDYYLRHRIKISDLHICIYRPGFDIEEAKKLYPENMIFVEGNHDETCSTTIRKALRENNDDVIKELVSEDVFNYLKNNDIFINNN